MNGNNENDIYSADYQRNLFNEMSKTYGIVNSISSFGFNYLWRKRCLDNAKIKDGDIVCDMMAGMGEMGLIIKHKINKLVCVDYSEEMVIRLKDNMNSMSFKSEIHLDNIFNIKFESRSFDKIICSFGIKTLRIEDRKCLVKVMANILKDHGIISIMEFKVPDNVIIRVPWIIYVRWIIPFIGMLFLGNSKNYRMLYNYAREYEKDGMLDFVNNDSNLCVETHILHFGSAINYVIKKNKREY